MNRNKELRKEHESLSKMNMGQIKALNTYDRETKYNEKVFIWLIRLISLRMK